jgi:hypothetical protein
MRRRAAHAALLLALAAAFAAPNAASAADAHYMIDGGTPAEQAAVGAALAASAFPWDVVPRRIAIHIRTGLLSHAIPGEIWLDAHLLDTGRFSWGVVQHEFAHQVDFYVLDDATRTELAQRLGGASWWSKSGLMGLAPDGSASHGALTAERFASTLAWAYWPTRMNVLRPESATDESAALPAAQFRALLAEVLANPQLAQAPPAPTIR